MTTGFGPSEFFIFQWPRVPEQLFRLLPRLGVLFFLLAREPGVSLFLARARALFLARDIS